MGEALKMKRKRLNLCLRNKNLMHFHAMEVERPYMHELHKFYTWFSSPSSIFRSATSGQATRQESAPLQMGFVNK